MARRYRVAIVGAGIGAAHNEAFQAQPDLFDVVLICDVDRERASRLAAAAPGAAICADLADVLEHADVDIVDISCRLVYTTTRSSTRLQPASM